MAVIFILSSFPNPPGSGGSDTRSHIAHVVVYAVLAVAAIRFARAQFPVAGLGVLLVAVWLFCIAYGISDEIHQSFVPRRQATAFDVMLDAIGAAIGLSLWVAWQRVEPLSWLVPGRRST